MKTYKIRLKLQGKMTQLPDSQKIFGALMYFNAELGSEKETTEFVRKIKDKEIYFSLSNLFPLDYFPTPIGELLENAEKNGKELYKAIKARQYVKAKELLELLKNPNGAKEIYPYVNIEEIQESRAFISSQCDDVIGVENKLFSIQEIRVCQIEKEGIEGKRYITEFCFYVTIDDSKECTQLIDQLQKAVKVEKVLIQGKRASQGFNTFTLQSVEEVEIKHDQEKRFLNMGMLLPDRINYEESTLKLFTSERRPYEMIEGWGNHTFNFISFIAEGSIIIPENGYQDASHCIPSPYDKNKSIVFGNGWLYPILEGGK